MGSAVSDGVPALNAAIDAVVLFVLYKAAVAGTNSIELPAASHADPPLSISDPETAIVALALSSATAAFLKRFLPADDPPRLSVTPVFFR